MGIAAQTTGAAEAPVTYQTGYRLWVAEAGGVVAGGLTESEALWRLRLMMERKAR